MAEGFEKYYSAKEFAALVPVPLHVSRRRSRGFNQALEIARPLSLSLGIRLEPRLLFRTRDTLAQSTLHLEQRQQNMRAAFAVSDAYVESLRGRHVGVVDDVMTTGATLHELAATLKRFGVARVTNTDKISLDFNLIKASALINGQNASTAQAVRGGIGYDRNVGPRLFVNVFNDYEYDKFQNLDLRFVIGGGFGFHAVKNKRSVLNVLGGADYNHSSFSTPLIRNAAEAFWGDEYALKLNGASSLTQSFRMFNNLSDTGAYRVNFDIGVSTKIKKWLFWNLALSDHYLSNPVPGRKPTDWLYTTGLGITIAR